MQFFNRSAAVTIGTMRIEDLRVTFSSRKTWTSEPNATEIGIYNLSDASKTAIVKGLPVTLEAGWGGRMAKIAKGHVLYVQSKRQGPDRVTTVMVTDGGSESAMTSVSHEGKFSVKEAIGEVIKDLKVGTQEAVKQMQQGKFDNAVDAWLNGFSASGKTTDVLDKIMGPTGFTWSIQDGELMFMKAGEPTKDSAIVLGPDSGLIGSPEVNAPVSGNVVIPMKTINFPCFLNPMLRPGLKVKLNGLETKGTVAIASVTHTGDTHGSDWSTKVEGWLR